MPASSSRGPAPRTLPEHNLYPSRFATCLKALSYDRACGRDGAHSSEDLGRERVQHLVDVGGLGPERKREAAIRWLRAGTRRREATHDPRNGNPCSDNRLPNTRGDFAEERVAYVSAGLPLTKQVFKWHLKRIVKSLGGSWASRGVAHAQAGTFN